jgi:hypothetical protein
MRDWHRVLPALFLLTLTAIAACNDDGGSSSDAGSGGMAGMAGAGSGGQGAAGDASNTTPCPMVCAIAESLDCPNETKCLVSCNGLYDAAQCRSELRAFIDCSVERPASDWECNEEGEADLKAGICQAQLDAVETCLGL